jgi:hypothetical protein
MEDGSEPWGKIRSVVVRTLAGNMRLVAYYGLARASSR